MGILMLKKAKRSNPMRPFAIANGLRGGLPGVPTLMAELLDMIDVLLGRAEPPVYQGVSTLMEVADAYLARGLEIRMHILQQEREGAVRRGSQYYRFRTGELAAFIEMAKSAASLGSRRVTVRQMTLQSERTGRH